MSILLAVRPGKIFIPAFRKLNLAHIVKTHLLEPNSIATVDRLSEFCFLPCGTQLHLLNSVLPCPQ